MHEISQKLNHKVIEIYTKSVEQIRKKEIKQK